MKKSLGVTYKMLHVIVEAVELKLLADQAKCDTTTSEDDRADLQNDIAFTKACLKDLRNELNAWLTPPA